MTTDLNAAYSYVCAKDRMNLPHRRVYYSHTLNQNILTTIRLNKIGSQIMALAKDSLAYTNRLLGHMLKTVSIRPLIRSSLLPAIICTTVPRPPGVVATLSVKCAFA